MKITDLMHGDWFRTKKGTCRINDIRWFTAIVEYYDEAYKDNGNVSAEEADIEYDLEPLPITTEMLEASRFQLTDLERWTKKDDDWEVNLKLLGGSLSITYKGNTIVKCCCIHYVHQLQHALRLAGFDQLADNFRLTKKQPLKS